MPDSWSVLASDLLGIFSKKDLSKAQRPFSILNL